VAPKLSHYNVITNEEERQSFDNKERIHKILALTIINTAIPISISETMKGQKETSSNVHSI
jgi:hypothetical protein